MSDVEETLKRSIEGKCGPEGVTKFCATYTGGYEDGDGAPDLPGIVGAIDRTFPADQASAIVAAFREKLQAGEKPSDGQAAVPAEGTDGGGGDVPPAFVRYFNADPDEVRDIVNEARRLRVAMGKAVPSHWAPHAGRPAIPLVPVMKASAASATIAATPGAEPSDTEAAAKESHTTNDQTIATQTVAKPLPTVEDEIRRFAYERKAHTSIDIMDFIRYLKDKGYSFQDYIVLEKIYVTIEERKKEARSAIEKEVEGLIDATQAPAEPDMFRLFQRLKLAGLVFDDEDVRRMVRDALMRRSSNG